MTPSPLTLYLATTIQMRGEISMTFFKDLDPTMCIIAVGLVALLIYLTVDMIRNRD